jgi:hypothetical protein
MVLGHSTKGLEMVLGSYKSGRFIMKRNLIS